MTPIYEGFIRPEALALYEKASPGDQPLCGGAAKVKRLDKDLVDRLPQPSSLAALEADFIASPAGLFYITPRLGTVYSWRWGAEIRSVRPAKRFGKFGGVLIDLAEQGVLEMRMPAQLVTSVIAVAARYGADHDAQK